MSLSLNCLQWTRRGGYIYVSKIFVTANKLVEKDAVFFVIFFKYLLVLECVELHLYIT